MLRENIRLALSALKANKLRTFLTMLGIIIGLQSVVMIMTIGSVMNNKVMDSMSGMGASNISFYVSLKQGESEDEDEENANVRELKQGDFITKEMMEDVLNKYDGRVKGIALSQEIGTTKVISGKKYANIKVTGVNPLAYQGSNLKLLSGSTFASGDYTNGTKVCLVSDKYVNNMYGGDANKALGQTVDAAINNKYYSYTIVGVYEYANRGLGGNTSQKSITTECYIPLKVAMQQNPQAANEIMEMTVVAADGQDSVTLGGQIAKYLNERYYKNNDTYKLDQFSMKQAAESLQSMVSAVKYAFMAVGAISLLVGGIGVMNIMVVSIVERTREIGTRKALGATNGYIRLQFITESIVVCVLGGVIGIVLGVLFGQIAALILGAKGMPSVVGILGCLAFSVGFGVFFGYYPANRAAKLNPIEALRYE